MSINKIETRPLALIAEADRILKQNGLIIITFEINDIQKKLGIDELVKNDLKRRGYLIERIPFPDDYPHSVELQEADFILIGWKNGEGLIFRQTMSCL